MDFEPDEACEDGERIDKSDILHRLKPVAS